MREDAWLIAHGQHPPKSGDMVDVYKFVVGEVELAVGVPDYPDLKAQIAEIIDSCYTDEQTVKLILEAVDDFYCQ